MAYDFAQTFYVDKTAVRGSPQVNISAVDLYFKTKPKIGNTANPNKSGLFEPGVSLLFTETNMDGTPNISKVVEQARLEYNDIVASGDATSASRFVFEKEVYCDTNKTYAIVVQFDGHEDFDLWTNKKGSYFLGTNIISSGVTDKSVGNLYITQDRPTASSDPNTAGGQGSINGTTGVQNSWVAKNDEDLVFEVYVARYRVTDPPTANNPANNISNNILLPHSTHEYILFDRKLSQREQKAQKGELIFQISPYYSNNGNVHTVNVQRGNTTVTSNNVNFTSVYPNDNGNNYIVLVSEGTDPAHFSNNYNQYNVRRVLSVLAANTIIVDRGPSFTNTASYFFVSPVAEVNFMDRSRSFDNWGRKWGWYYGWYSWWWGHRNRQDFLVLENSNANLTHRFVNNSINNISITAAGQGYSNTDYIVITSASNGAANAYANVRTNSSGNITSIFMTNTGYGMVAYPTFQIRANSSSLSSGSGANLSFTEGPTLISETNKFNIKDIEVINFEIDSITPMLVVNNPAGTSYFLKHQLSYYQDANGAYVVNQNASSNKKLIKNMQKNGLPYSNTPVLVSRSNEVVLLSNQSGNSVVIDITTSSNSDFIDTCLEDTTVMYHRNIINNDYTNEHTSFGNAQAKHVSKKITFQSGRLAEDLLVIIRAYRPANTDVKVYARLYNSADPEAYDDKDWTLLDCVSGGDQYSSPTDKNDLREYTYNVPQYPNTIFTSVGTVTLASGCTVVEGIGTTFTSEIAGFSNNDLVKIYSPLLPQNHYITSVASVTNSTSLVLADSTTNTSFLGTGLKIDKIKYSHQAFRNISNDNVVRYYNSSMHAFDGYDTFSIKTILLSSTSSISPEVEDIRAVGVSS